MGNKISKPSQQTRSQPSQQIEDTEQLQHQKTTRLPENIDDILADADPAIDKSCRDKLCDQLSSSGIFLCNKTQKFWLNSKLNYYNCCMLYARALDITWGSDQRYWKWESFQESSETSIEVAELIRVCYLEVKGKLDTNKLTPGVMYGVSYHVKLRNAAQYSWSVNVSLKMQGVKYQERKMNLSEMLKGTWMEIPVAQFIAPAHDIDDKARKMDFWLWDYGGNWKRGLIVKGVSIKPL